MAGETFDLALVGRARERGRASTELLERGLVARGRRRRAARSGTRSRARRCTPTCRGCGGARCTASSPRRSSARGAPAPRGRPALARRARRARAPARRCCARRPSREAVHAYRDAAARRPPGARAVAGRARTSRARPRRSSATRAAAELAGELAEAARALARAGRGRRAATARVAAAQRRLAAVHELRGDREARGRGAARRAADAFAADGPPAEAAVERLAIANQRRLAARHGEAVELARRPRARTPTRAGRLDLRVRALGLEGMARAKHGDYEARPRDRPRRPRARARARPDRRSPPSSTSGSA